MLDKLKLEFKLNIDNKYNLFSKKLNKYNLYTISLPFFENLIINYQINKKLLLKNIAHITLLNSTSLKIYIYDILHKNSIINNIQKCNLEFNIAYLDKHTLKVTLPTVSLEQRKLFIKLLDEEIDNQKISLKNFRQDFKKKIKKMFLLKQITKDELIKTENYLQQLINHYLQKISEVINQKKNNIMNN